MKKINFKGLDIAFYKETLKNKLDIYLIPYENKKNYFISYGTHFGSDVIEFENNKEKYRPPLGIAHFLEHKMFEQESTIDPFEFFLETGTDGNASTSFDSTQYICYGTKGFERNLKFLLEFVNSPYFTDKNVEKEKGIIAEEIKMYADVPDYKLETVLREALYKNNPRRLDIAGTVAEINKITKEDLYTCYNNFYTPENMFVLVVGNFDKDKALEIIKEVVGNKETKPLPKIIIPKEPNEVFKKSQTLKANIEVPKLAFGLKVPTSDLNLTGIELDLYLSLLTTILFGASSEFRETARTEKLLNNIYTEWETTTNFKTYYLLASTEKPNELLKEIKNVLANISITEQEFNRLKKVWISNEVKMIDNINATVSNVYDDIIKYQEIIPNRLDLIKNLKLSILEELINKIDFENTSDVIMTKNI